MKVKNPDEVANEIFNRLSSQSFADWYSDEGQFGRFISDDDPKYNGGLTKEKILGEIKSRFNITKD